MYRLRPSAGLGIVGGPLTQCDVPVAAWFSGECWSRAWDGLFGPKISSVAPPQTPTGAVLTTPPASGEEAQATVDALLNQQLREQQALNAAGVTSGVFDTAASGVVSAGNVVSEAIPWVLFGAIGLGVFALVAISGGSPRRYGR